MGKTYRELKNKIEQLRFENSFLTSKVQKVLLENGRVKRELQVSNAHIVELAQELELLKNGLPFLDEVKDALNDEDFFTEKVGEPILEKMVESDVAFSSRFMPNVKFYAFPSRDMDETYRLIEELERIFNGNKLYYAYETNANGNIYNAFESQNIMDKSKKQLVSIYEAIPELVPDGMIYDKESDSLVKKSNDGISSFTKKLAESVPFTYLQIQWVENTFGSEKTKMILDMCSSCGVEVYELQPLKKK